MSKSLSQEDVDAFSSRFNRIIVVLVLVFVIPWVIYGFYVHRRFDSLANSLKYQPPQEVEESGPFDRNDYLSENPVQGQVVYVPAYSHIYHKNGSPNLLTITLSIRNTSLEHSIRVKSIRYFDSKGKEVKSYLTKPVIIEMLGSTEVLIERDDVSGGSGANFLVEWVADRKVTEPIIEAVMVDTDNQQGISFVSGGRVVREIVPEKKISDSIQEIEAGQ